MTNNELPSPGEGSDPATNSTSASVTIRNERGLHARASAKFVQCAEQFTSNVTVSRDNQSVGGTSIMGLMMLAAGPGISVQISTEGADAIDALKALVALVEDGFGEMGDEVQPEKYSSIDQA